MPFGPYPCKRPRPRHPQSARWIINIVERCNLYFISPEVFTAALSSPFINKGLINKSATGKRATEMQWYFMMIEPKTQKTERTRCRRFAPGFIRAHNPSHQKNEGLNNMFSYFFCVIYSFTHTDLWFIFIKCSSLLDVLCSGIQLLTVSAAPHSVPWNQAGKSHATAFVCDCLVVLTVLAGNISILLEAIWLLRTTHHSSVLFGFLVSISDSRHVFPFPGLGGRVRCFCGFRLALLEDASTQKSCNGRSRCKRCCHKKPKVAGVDAILVAGKEQGKSELLVLSKNVRKALQVEAAAIAAEAKIDKKLNFYTTSLRVQRL